MLSNAFFSRPPSRRQFLTAAGSASLLCGMTAARADDPIGKPREEMVAILDLVERCVQNLAFRLKHGREV